MNIGSGLQPTDFALDVLGRYVCNTFDEAMANSDFGYRAGATDRNGNVLAYQQPILLLTDEFSISSAEIFAALFQDAKRGPILGWRTAGAGGSIRRCLRWC